ETKEKPQCAAELNFSSPSAHSQSPVTRRPSRRPSKSSLPFSGRMTARKRLSKGRAATTRFRWKSSTRRPASSATARQARTGGRATTSARLCSVPASRSARNCRRPHKTRALESVVSTRQSPCFNHSREWLRFLHHGKHTTHALMNQRKGVQLYETSKSQ